MSAGLTAQRPYCLDCGAAPVVEAVGVVFPGGTRSIDWQNWHFTILPRSSSGTDKIFLHLRLGHINCTGMAHSMGIIDLRRFVLESPKPPAAPPPVQKLRLEAAWR